MVGIEENFERERIANKQEERKEIAANTKKEGVKNPSEGGAVQSDYRGERKEDKSRG